MFSYGEGALDQVEKFALRQEEQKTIRLKMRLAELENDRLTKEIDRLYGKSGSTAKEVRSEARPEIKGPTFAKLMQAIEAFPAEYPDYKTNPPQKKSVQAWLPSTFNLEDKDRTSVVFAKIIFEHFGIG